MLELDILFNLSKKDCMLYVTTIENSEGCLDLMVIRHTCARGSLTIGVGWSSASFPFIISLFKFKSNRISLVQVTSTNSSTMFYATISFIVHCLYSSICIFSLPSLKKEMRLADLFVASFIFTFSRSSSMAKLAFYAARKILIIL